MIVQEEALLAGQSVKLLIMKTWFEKCYGEPPPVNTKVNPLPEILEPKKKKWWVEMWEDRDTQNKENEKANKTEAKT